MIFHRNTNADKGNKMTKTFDRYAIPGMGPRIDLERGWLDFATYPRPIAEKVVAFRQADEAKLRELCVNFTDEKFERPVLPIERQLLGHIGFRKLPGDLQTTVQARWMGRMSSSGYYPGDALTVVYTWPALEDTGARQAPHLPPTNIRFHNSLESAALVAQVHKDAAIEAMKALDNNDTEMARSWLDAIVAHCEHPTEGWE